MFSKFQFVYLLFIFFLDASPPPPDEVDIDSKLGIYIIFLYICSPDTK